MADPPTLELEEPDADRVGQAATIDGPPAVRGDATAHFVLVGDSSDLATLQGIVSRLPVNAYWQIFIEIATGRQAQPWTVPPGVTLTWLRRDRMASVLGGLAHRGELAARAVTAWVAEWIPEHHRDHELTYVLWIGCSASSQIDHLYRHLAQRFESLHLHHPHD